MTPDDDQREALRQCELAIDALGSAKEAVEAARKVLLFQQDGVSKADEDDLAHACALLPLSEIANAYQDVRTARAIVSFTMSKG